MSDGGETLSREERRALLQLARAAVQEELLGDGSLESALAGLPRTPAVLRPRPCFVTLRRRLGATAPPALRGCIGTLEADDPLYACVITQARNAAFRDPRFPPVTEDELPHLVFEVSALTPMRPVPGPEAIEPGRHGVQLSLGPYRSVFLPKVAEEQGWDRETMLRHLAMKAGLGPEAWRDATFHVFEAESFSEDDAG